MSTICYLLEPLAQVLTKLGVTDGMVVFGEAVLDELSTACDTRVCEFHGSERRTYTLTPEHFGFARATRDDLRGGTPQENAQVTRGILDGTIRDARRDTVLMNAGAGLATSAGRRSHRRPARAAQLVDSGAAARTLDDYIAGSRE